MCFFFTINWKYRQSYFEDLAEVKQTVYKNVTVFKDIKINICQKKILFHNLLKLDFTTEFPLDFKAILEYLWYQSRSEGWIIFWENSSYVKGYFVDW